MNRGTAEGSETSEQEYLTRRFRFFRVQCCSDVIWKATLKKRWNWWYKNVPGRSEFSFPRAFQRWCWNFRSPSGLSRNWFFMCVATGIPIQLYYFVGHLLTLVLLKKTVATIMRMCNGFRWVPWDYVLCFSCAQKSRFCHFPLNVYLLIGGMAKLMIPSATRW